ncbi:MAG: ester cyclase [Proteobacteria bacterium]|nr:ester cyclase [Pseudomonadota bacterium]
MEAKNMIEGFMNQLWVEKDITAIDRFFTTETIIHSSLRTATGPHEMRDIVERWLEAFPDLHCTWDDWISEKDKVMVRWHARGTHLGEFLNFPATKNKIHYMGVSIYRLQDNKIAEYWGIVDMHTLVNQINGI